MADQLSEKFEGNGWSVVPRCSWLVLDNNGDPCCKYRALRENLVALRIAQYTSFDQRYVGEAIENWKQNTPVDYTYCCAPTVCPSSLARFLNALHE